ncbi:MAG TPA: FeoB-associated Cys-rich membrane protein [Candidatus Scatovicinus merdipullorum]|nr:FeoB-associated Cys-rich membrane protein [Candidatus Scatovicinus merdipullorum]
MLEWILQNLSTILITAALLAVVLLIIRHLYKARKRGGCAGCSGNCGACCHTHAVKKDTLSQH